MDEEEEERWGLGMWLDVLESVAGRDWEGREVLVVRSIGGCELCCRGWGVTCVLSLRAESESYELSECSLSEFVRCESSQDPPPGVVLPGVMGRLELSVEIVVSEWGGVLCSESTFVVVFVDDEEDDEDEGREREDGGEDDDDDDDEDDGEDDEEWCLVGDGGCSGSRTMTTLSGS